MIFVSHAWNNGKPEDKVLQLVDFLRKNGYEAECDVLYQQQKTAIHFTEMMADALRRAEKTIIVLSENYKTRADDFKGGVGTEYRYIIDDFSVNENGYILVSFSGRNPQIIPDFLKGRDIVDLVQDEKNEYRELFSKLAGTPKIEFSPVSSIRTVPHVKTIDNFSAVPTEKLSSRLNINFSDSSPMTELDKKTFLRESFGTIISLLKELSDEFCSENPYFQIVYEQVDSVTVVFDMYKNKRNIHAFQIWFGNLMGSREYSIFIGNSIGSKNSFSEMINCVEINGNPSLKLTMNNFFNNNDGSIEEIIKQLWKCNFELYLRVE